MTDSKLREALEPFARLADSVDAAALSYLGVGLAGLVGETALPVGGNAIRDKCSISVEALIAAREALATPPVVEGDWVAVPREATMAMLNAAIDTDHYKLGDISPLGFRCSPQTMFERCWSAMLAAAPSAPVVGEGGDLADQFDRMADDYSDGKSKFGPVVSASLAAASALHLAAELTRRHSASSSFSVLAEGLHAQIYGIHTLADPQLSHAALADGGTIHEAAHALIRALPATPPQSPPEPVDVGREDWAFSYRLEWIAAPRPPVHPAPMTGVQSFASFDSAMSFMSRQSVDTQFVSLTEISVQKLNLTERAILALSPTGAK